MSEVGRIFWYCEGKAHPQPGTKCNTLSMAQGYRVGDDAVVMVESLSSFGRLPWREQWRVVDLLGSSWIVLEHPRTGEWRMWL